MKRPENLLERFAENWPYGLALIPIAAERLGHDRPLCDLRTLTVDALSGLLILALVAVIQRKNRELDEVSVTDRLTGLFNSRYLRAELDRQVALAHRARSPLALIFMDVDNLKTVNDRFGHVSGDHLLRLFAQTLLGKVRGGMDLCFRFGGDEFLVLCPQTEPSTALEIAGRVLRAPHELGPWRARGATLSVAVIALREGEAPVEFLRRADRLLYTAKQLGKNRIECDRVVAALRDR